jgi:hypothetical protein
VNKENNRTADVDSFVRVIRKPTFFQGEKVEGSPPTCKEHEPSLGLRGLISASLMLCAWTSHT